MTSCCAGRGWHYVDGEEVACSLCEPGADWAAAHAAHRCAGPRCANLISSGVVCEACYARAGRQLRQLPAEWAALMRLSLTPSPSGGLSDDRVGGTREHALPGGEAWAVASEIAGGLFRWEDSVRRWQGFTRVRRDPLLPAAASNWARQVVNAARFLHASLDVLVTGPAGATPLEDIDHWCATARAELGETSGDVPFPMPCPGCGRDALVRRNGGGFIECAKARGGCGTATDVDRLIRGAATRKPDGLVTAARAAELTQVHRSTVLRWARSGRLVAAACNARTRAALYRVGDVLHLYADTARERETA